MPDRFFHDPPLALGPVLLAGPEAHHLIHVLRAKPGLEVVLFDGSGAEYAARVERIERSAVALSVWERREIDREAPLRITLGVALPKGDRQKWLVEKATELGVLRLVPLETCARRGPAGRRGTRSIRARRDRGVEAMRPKSVDGDRAATAIGPVRCRAILAGSRLPACPSWGQSDA